MSDTVVGLDLSLTGAGVAILILGQPPAVHVIKSTNTGAALRERWQRLTGHLDRVLDTAFQVEGAHAKEFDVVIEAPSYGSMQGSQHDRSGFWWMVVNYLLTTGHSVTEVPPSTVKKFATGKGNVDKDAMAWVTAREFPAFDAPLGNDAVDALWLATMGHYHQDPDLSGVAVTKYRDAAVKAVHWEDR